MKISTFYMPSEWQPHQACWMAWPCHRETWASIGLERAQKAYAKVAQAIAQFEPVTILVNPCDAQKARNLCLAYPPELNKNHPISFMEMPINDSWTRDTGPTFLCNASGQLAGIDWIHNAWGENYPNYQLDQHIAAAIIHETQATPIKAPLVMEGGAFHVDGEGTVLTTRECLLNPNRNPQLSQHEIEQYLHTYLGTQKTIWLNRGLVGDETNGHVDEIACFVAPGKVLCLITHDKDDANYLILQENLHILQAATDAKNRRLEIITVEQPPATYINNTRLTLSYINFYLANQGAVVPAFGYEKEDYAALKCFTSLFPDRKITQINALDIFAGGGGIHCITQQQPLCAKLSV